MNSPNPSGYGSPFSVVLSILSLVILLCSAYFFKVGWDQYVGNEFIDSKLKLIAAATDTHWIPLLFALPPLAETVGIVFLFPKVHRDKRLITFFAFCLFIMSLCPLSYCWLWTKYTSGAYNQDFYSSLALVFIALLLLPVAMMTYAIMWKRGGRVPKHKWELRESEVSDWPTFCSQLKSHNGALSSVRLQILRLLPESLVSQIPDATAQSDFDNLSKAKLVEEVNRILKRRDLHLHVNFGQELHKLEDEVQRLLQRAENLSDGEVQRLNALLLKACFPNEISGGPAPLDKWSRLKERIYSRWENYLGNIQTGVESVQFWVLVFFFTVYLGINFLFGFAFAFHDKRNIENTKIPALYMAKFHPSASDSSTLDESGKDNRQISGASSGGTKAEAPRFSYIFYFDSKSAIPNYKYTPFDGKAYERSKSGISRRNKEWREGKNVEHVDQISKTIIANTSTGEALRIELKGSADDSVLREGTTYSSNYSLSEARAQNIKYVLLGKLAEQDKRERRIEWLVLPLSSEQSLGPPLSESKRKNIEESKQSYERKQTRMAVLGPRERRLLEETDRNQEKQNLRIKFGSDLTEDDGKFLDDRVDAIYDAAKDRGLTIEEKQGLISKLEELAQMLRDAKTKTSSEDENRAALDNITQKKNELKEALEVMDYVEKDAGRRIVTVSLISIKHNDRFIPLTLLDFMYFSTYTITTTGYGDIVPTTGYAKFLCSFANILAIFFLVVFFNALISVKGTIGSRRTSTATSD